MTSDSFNVFMFFSSTYEHKISCLRNTFLEEYYYSLNHHSLIKTNALLCKWVNILFMLLNALSHPDLSRCPFCYKFEYEDETPHHDTELAIKHHIQSLNNIKTPRGVTDDSDYLDALSVTQVDITPVAEIGDNDIVTKDEPQLNREVLNLTMEKDAGPYEKIFVCVGTQTINEDNGTQTDDDLEVHASVTVMESEVDQDKPGCSTTLPESIITPLTSHSFPPSTSSCVPLTVHINSPKNHGYSSYRGSKTVPEGEDRLASSDSDTASKKSPTISKAQRIAWKKKKRLVYEHRSSSSIEAKTKQNRMKASKTQIENRNKSVQDNSVWLVSKFTNFTVQSEQRGGILQIFKVSDEPPCLISRKTIGILGVSNFHLKPS